MDLIHQRCCIYALEYHLVWCVKYRRKVLTGQVETILHKTLYEQAAKGGFNIAEMNGGADHIHLLIQAPPTVYIPDMVQSLKGVSARRLFQETPWIRKKLWGGRLWNPSYFIVTVSDRTEEQIRDYIRSQKEA